MTDYTILAKPRISERCFARILAAAGSSAAGPAAACYAAAVRYGVDPAVLLAVFQHESNFGRAGAARTTKSWGNLRGPDGQFKRYRTWPAGAADTARLLAIYGRNAIRPGRKTDTTQTFPYVWAPATDHNAPDKYGDAITTLVTGWIRACAGVVTATKPAGAAGRLEAPGVQLFHVSRGVATPSVHGTLHGAWVGGARHYRPNATLRHILSGPHRLEYVHANDGELTR